MKHLALIALLFSPIAYGKDCPAPPVANSTQAVCYATNYAAKNGLAHGQGLKTRAKKGRTGWTVSFTDTRPNAPSKGWQVDVDEGSGTVTRFSSYKKPER
ncbi:MAG TPA: hypothetical protein VFK84_09205 [Burkholderiales bacterium]|nr:hypothetical protein [Burkholderiales bacterium]